MTTFSSLGLSEKILQGIAEAGYTSPTEIQAKAVPAVIDGGDLTGCAQTGTGKTAAFVLPMLHRLAATGRSGGRKHVRALVLTPTRELALQVEDSVRTYGKFTGLQSVAVYGGVGMEPQIRAFRRGVDIVIATPGRLLDHMSRGTLDLSRIDILVLDEADRMFDMGFINDVRKIVRETPKERQTLLFSATMPPAIQDLAASIQRSPRMVEVGQRRSPAESVAQFVYRVEQDAKLDLLLHLLRTEPVSSVLVFSRTKHRADKITHKLNQKGIASAAIHSNRTQNQRQNALDAFKRGNVRVLVATDIAARGIDVDGISHVINFDTPAQAEDYIHRIGRTGRAQTTGDALTFVSSGEMSQLRSIEKFTGKRIEQRRAEGVVAFADTPDAPRRHEPKSAPSSSSSSRNGGTGGNRRGRPGQGSGSGRRSNSSNSSSSRDRRW